MRLFVGILVCFPLTLLAQIGGSVGYQSLSVANNPRSAALGGNSVSLSDGDVSQFFGNPATLDSVNSGSAFFQFNPYFTDANFYSVAYAFDVKDLRGFAIGLHYLDFGSFELTDDTGQELGSFSASDYVAFISKSHQVGPFTLGASFKYLNSTIDAYSSSAVAVDLGGVFYISKQWSVAMVFENMGFQLSRFSDFSNPDLPFDVRIGTTFKPKYMPLRFTVTSNSLTNDSFVALASEEGRSNATIDKVLRTVNFGAELLLNKNVQLLAGYNHKRKQELRLDELGGGAGFSYGMMLKISRFQFRFSRATYHAAGGTSFLSLQTNINDFKKIL